MSRRPTPTRRPVMAGAIKREDARLGIDAFVNKQACRSGGAERLTTGAKAIVPTPRGCAIADQVEVIAHRILRRRA